MSTGASFHSDSERSSSMYYPFDRNYERRYRVEFDVSFASFMIEDRVRDFYVHSHYSFPISDLSAKLLYIYLARVLIFVNLYIRVNKIRACIARMCVCTFVICVAVLIHILTCVIVYTCFARLWRCIKFTR